MNCNLLSASRHRLPGRPAELRRSLITIGVGIWLDRVGSPLSRIAVKAVDRSSRSCRARRGAAWSPPHRACHARRGCAVSGGRRAEQRSQRSPDSRASDAPGTCAIEIARDRGNRRQAGCCARGRERNRIRRMAGRCDDLKHHCRRDRSGGRSATSPRSRTGFQAMFSYEPRKRSSGAWRQIAVRMQARRIGRSAIASSVESDGDCRCGRNGDARASR